MATVASLLVKLGLDSKKFDAGVKKVVRGLSSMIQRTEKLTSLGKISAFAGLIGSAVALTGAIAPASGAILALPAAALLAGAGIATLAAGLSGVGTALSATGGTAAELEEALSALAPSAQAFVRSFAGVRSSFAPVQQAVQQKLFAGLGEELSALATGAMPTLRRGMTAVASALNGLGSEALRTMNTPLFKGQLGQIFDGTAKATSSFSGVLSPLLVVLAQLAIAGLPLIDRFNEWAAGALSSAAAFLTSEAGAARLAGIVQRAGDVLAQLGAIAGNIGSLLGGIFGGASTSGQSLLNTLQQLTASWAAWANSAQGQEQIGQVFNLLVQIGTQLIGILPAVAAVIGTISAAFAMLPPGVQSAVSSFLAWSLVLGGIGSKVAPALGAIKTLTAGAKTVAGPLGKFGKTLLGLGTKALIMGAKMLAGWILGMGPIGWIIAAIIALVALVIIYWDEIVAVITAAWQWIKTAAMTAWNGLVAFLTAVWTGIVTTATTAWNALKAAVVAAVMFVVNWVRTQIAMFVLALQVLWLRIKLAAITAWLGLQIRIRAIVAAVVGWVRKKIAQFVLALKVFWLRIKITAISAWVGLQSRVRAVVAAVVSWVRGKITGFVNNLKAAWNLMKSTATSAFNRLKSVVRTAITNVVSTVKGIPGKIRAVFSNAKNILLNAGKNIIRGLIDGVSNMIGSLRDKFSSVTNMIPDWKGPMAVDLRLLTPSGEALMQGLSRGVEAGLPGLRSMLRQVTNEIPSNVSTSSTVRHSGGQSVRVVFDVTGADEQMRALIRKIVRTSGGGSVQAALGTR